MKSNIKVEQTHINGKAQNRIGNNHYV